MMKLKPYGWELLLLLLVPWVFFTCSHKNPVNIQEAHTEAWELQFTGDTVGNLKMLLTRIKIEDEIYSLTGKISGIITDRRAGSGTADYNLKGKIEQGIFKATISGNSNMEVGPSPTSGSMSGTMHESQGSGKFSVLHAFGSSHGNYTMIKSDSVR